MTPVIREDASRETESRGQTMTREATRYPVTGREAARLPPSGKITQVRRAGPPGYTSLVDLHRESVTIYCVAAAHC